MTVGNVPTFVDIDDVDSVYRLVSDLREKARTKVSSKFLNTIRFKVFLSFPSR